MKAIKTALISVYHKDNLEKILEILANLQVELYSTGGTHRFISEKGYSVHKVEDLTGYPSILGGRVKTLHPKVFGGILYRSEEAKDLEEIKKYEVPTFDLVIVDLYPFEDTLATGGSPEEVIEKIDIGGIALIRASAKNYKDITIVSSRDQYNKLVELLEAGEGKVSLEDRKHLATEAFALSSHYDTAIFNYFNQDNAMPAFKQSITEHKTLRYGENPHQQGIYYGKLNDILEQLHGKELSFNNLVDIDAAISLMDEFEDTAFAILKHTNACGVAIADTPKEAYLRALAADPISAFGGVIISNHSIDKATAEELHKLFFEVLIAPSYDEGALEILKQKKNRVLLIQKQKLGASLQFKSLLNGVIVQERDTRVEAQSDLETITDKSPNDTETRALLFANTIAKHTKSNTIVLARDNQLLASGVGQTSRVDALKQAIMKAEHFGFELGGAVMASDAFFPFPDCVEIAHKAGITAVIQPGGSKKDQDSIDYCNKNGLSMVFTGVRHFKH